jgi:type VI secretion system Hcp family effector
MKRIQIYHFAIAVCLLQIPALSFAQNEPVVAYVTITANTTGAVSSESQVNLNNSNSQKIDLVGYNYTMKTNLNIGSQTSGAGAGKANPVTFQIVKHYDSTSPDLAQDMTSGKMLTINLYVYQKSGDPSAIMQEVEFRGAAITQITQFAGIGSSSSSAMPDEELTITALKMEIHTANQAVNGPSKVKPAAGYDLKANKKQ